ncbi:MAG TPA: hypothetical protein VFA85_17455 [Terriglobales bacterium]|nr:hypothetical protein [Terriglobales bacterium]
MPKAPKPHKPQLPTTRESLARIASSLASIARSLEFGLYDSKGDAALDAIQSALTDIAQYGPGKAPKERYEWRTENAQEA